MLLLAAIVGGSRLHPPEGHGLRTVFTSGSTTIDAGPSPPGTSSLDPIVARAGTARHFSAVWSGYLWADGGDYIVLLSSDDSAELLVDGSMVVDHRGEHPLRTKGGHVSLLPGSHAVEVRYEQFSGHYGLQVAWTEAGGLPRAWTDERWRLSERPLTIEEAAQRRRQARTPAVLVALGLAGILVLYLAAGWWLAAAARRSLGVPRANRVEIALLAPAAIWLAWGLQWGLLSPGFAWAPDEISPFVINPGYALGFRNGWSDTYPPLLFYLAAPGPWIVDLVASDWEWVTTHGPGQGALHTFVRAVVLLTALGALAGLHALQRQRLSSLASGIGCAAAWLSPTIVYYSRTANPDIPALMFVIWACAFLYAYFYRLAERHLYAAAVLATLAFCTKDQMGGLFALWPVAVIALEVAARLRAERSQLGARGSRIRAAISWAVLDRRWVVAAGAVALTLAAVYQLPFNAAGASEHVRLLRSGVYPAHFPATWAGYVGFLAELADLVVFVGGPALTALALAGWLWALGRREWGLVGVLLLPTVSYLVSFLLPVRYAYDRYVIVVWTLFALGLAYLVDSARERRWTFRPVVLVAALALADAVARGTVVGALQAADNRYALERFFGRHVPVNASIGFLGPRPYFPRVAHPQTEASYDLLIDPGPDVIVINTDIVDRYSARNGPAVERLLQGASAYRPVLRCGPPSWPTLGVAASLKRYGHASLTNLDKINPSYIVYARIPLPGVRSESTCVAPDARG
jgi:hypothetical protein